MRVSLCVRVTVAAACVATAATAQFPARFVELRKQHAPFAAPDPRSGTVGDIDGDGDVDIVVGDQSSRVLRNDGLGVFTDDTAGRIPQFGEATWTRLLLDVDGDGDLDLVLGSASSLPGTVLSNDGGGRFAVPAIARLPAATTRIVRMVPADVDADGDPDLVVLDGLVVRVYANDGAGTFRVVPDPLGASTVRANTLTVGDVDGDGSPDLILGWDRTMVFSNDGTGRFAELVGAVPATRAQPTAVALGDADGDGDLDLAEVGLVNLLTAAESRWLANDGTGRFAEVAGLPTARAMGKVVAFADLDGDSDLDLLEAPPTGELLVRSNDGAGTFTSFAATAWRSGTNQDWIGIADTDGDGDLDVIAPSWDQGGAIDVWINDGSARFRGGSTLDFSRRVPGVIASGDLDGDGLADAVTLAGGEAIGIARNDGTGVLVDRPLTVQVRTTAAALFDADGDGDQDLLLVAGSSAFQVQPRLFENDGAGGFIERTQAQMPARSTEGRAVHVADQDADGDLDVLIVGRPSLLLENVGGGRFVDRSFVRLPDPGFAIQCAAWGDVDGDGAADLVVHGTAAGGGRATTELWRNVGLRGFAAVPGAFDASPPWAEDVLLVDIDRDGDLDCVLGGAFDDGVWINDGAQRFVAAAAFIDFRPGTVLDLTLADVDDDGTDELLARVRRSLTQPHRLVYDLRIFRNVGGAYAEDLDAAIRIGAVPAAVFDLDGDGDLDVVEGHRVLTNTTRQLHAPLVPRTGGRARFAFRVLPAGPALALPLIADAALALPLATPFGALRLDPDRMVAAAGPIAFDTEASLDVLVPNDPALTGVTLHVQALLVDPAARARLSSAVAERIVR